MPTRAGEVVFPGRDWLEARPEDQAVDSAKLQRAIRTFTRQVGRDGVHQMLIMRHGYVIWKGDRIDRVHGVWSCTKSFTSTVLGLLVDDGKCRLDTRAATFAPELREHYPEVTLRHFATMTSGYRAVGDEPRGGYTHGPSLTPFQPSPKPLFTPPGSHFAYWDSAMNEFGLVLTRIAGEPMDALFKRRIADPIGMNPKRWQWGDLGEVDGVRVNGGAGNHGGHIFISAREFARLGLLFLNQGVWNGRRLLSADWIREATRVQVPADLPLGHKASGIDGRGVYGLNWWCNGTGPDGRRRWPGVPPETFAARGYNNNAMFVIPPWSMVIVRLGLDQADRRISEETWAAFLRAVGQAIETHGSGAEPQP